MTRSPEKEKGFTIIELMIVVMVLGILAGIAIPNFLDLKDKAVWGTARGNMDAIRSALAAYATDHLTNLYPVGSLDFSGIRSNLPKASLPAAEADVQFRTGTFLYTSIDGLTYSFRANCANRESDLLTASPSGIIPSSYEDH